MAPTILLASIATLWLAVGARHPAGDPGALACAAILPTHIRVLDCRLAATVNAALPHSATLRRQFDRIADLQGIVYVATAARVSVTRKHLRGALSHQVGVSGSICVLRITLAFDDGDRAVGSLAHELHHAIEVLEHPEARTESAIDALFTRIGTLVGHGVYETGEAVATQMRVIGELKASRRLDFFPP